MVTQFTNDLGNTQLTFQLANGKEVVLNVHPNNEIYCVTVLAGGEIIMQDFCNPNWAVALEESAQ